MFLNIILIILVLLLLLYLIYLKKDEVYYIDNFLTNEEYKYKKLYKKYKKFKV